MPFLGKTSSVARVSDMATIVGWTKTMSYTLGRSIFAITDRVFGIKNEDRLSHVYVIGKTGTGKSTMIETMALQDLERGNRFTLRLEGVTFGELSDP
jgi:ABC-type lipoprotein export system ATPase subunit